MSGIIRICHESCQEACADWQELNGRLDNIGDFVEKQRKLGHSASAGVWYCPGGPNESVIGPTNCTGRLASEPEFLDNPGATEDLQTLVDVLPKEEDRFYLDE